MATKRSDLRRCLWSIALRGGMDASQRKGLRAYPAIHQVRLRQGCGQAARRYRGPLRGQLREYGQTPGRQGDRGKITMIIGCLAEANDLKSVIDVADYYDEEQLSGGRRLQSALVDVLGHALRRQA